MAPKKRKLPSVRARSQRVVERDVLPKAVEDLARRREAASDVCGACLLGIELGSQVALLDNCPHIFHVECAERWSKTENTCPQCKQRFFWLAAYSQSGRRESLSRVERRDQEGEEDDDYEDVQVCEMCKQVGDESALLLCDGMHGTCNAAYHLGCVGLSAVPRGSWFCPDCCERGFDMDARGRRRPPAATSGAPASQPRSAQDTPSPVGRQEANGSGSAGALLLDTPSPPGRRVDSVSVGALRLDAPPSETAAGAPASSATCNASTQSSQTSGARLDPVDPGGPTTADIVDVSAAPRPCDGLVANAVASIAAAPARGPASVQRRGIVPVPAPLRLSALACVSPAIEVPAFRAVAAGGGAGAPADGGSSGVFASFVQRRRAQRSDAAGSDTAGGGFITLNPTYEDDFMGGKTS